MSNSKQVVWITGASSGIGEALAYNYSSSGWTVVLSARKELELERVASKCTSLGGNPIVLRLDLNDIESFDGIISNLKTQVDKIDLMINNGGISQRSTILNSSLSTDRKIFEINYFGTIELSRKVLPWMIEKGGAHVAIMSSIAGTFGFPQRSTYSASKHAVIGFYETMDLEHRDDNIKVSVICPGRIRTNISLSALTGDGQPQKTMDKGLRDGMDVDKCARKIRKGLDRKKYRIYVGGKELLMVYFHKYIPSLFRKIAAGIDPK